MKVQIFVLLIMLVSCRPSNNEQYDLLIENVNIIDVESGNIFYSQDVLIRDSIIAQIKSSDGSHHRTVNLINGTDKYLIPSFWDMHVHIQDISYLQMFLDYGITGVRDMGGCVNEPTDGCESLCPEQLNQWKADIKRGDLEGPSLYIAGPNLSGTGWPTSFSAKTKEEVVLAIETNLNNQVDFIKVYEQIPADAYREIARLCKIHNLDFAGHVSESLLLSEISDLGQKSIEHIREQILYCFTNDPDELESFMVADSYTQEGMDFVKPWIEDVDRAIEAFKQNNTWFVPTMTTQYATQRYNDSLWISNPIRKQLPESVNKGLTEHMNRMRDSPDKIGNSLYWMALKKLVNRFNSEGIGLLAGSDIACEGGIPGYSLHEELFLMVEEAGLTPIEAIRTATLNPCQYFDLSNRGQVKKSYFADLVLLSDNPLQEIRNTLLIDAVIKNGKIQKRNKNDHQQ